MRIVGIDPSTKKIAMVGVDTDTGEYWYEAAIIIEPGEKSYTPDRAFRAMKRTMSALESHDVEAAFVEAPLLGAGGVKTTLLLGYVAGAVQAGALGAGVPVTMVNVQTWKAAIGKGNASKDDVLAIMRVLWPELRPEVLGDRDLTDASAICWSSWNPQNRRLVAKETPLAGESSL